MMATLHAAQLAELRRWADDHWQAMDEGRWLLDAAGALGDPAHPTPPASAQVQWWAAWMAADDEEGAQRRRAAWVDATTTLDGLHALLERFAGPLPPVPQASLPAPSPPVPWPPEVEALRRFTAALGALYDDIRLLTAPDASPETAAEILARLAAVVVTATEARSQLDDPPALAAALAALAAHLSHEGM